MILITEGLKLLHRWDFYVCLWYVCLSVCLSYFKTNALPVTIIKPKYFRAVAMFIRCKKIIPQLKPPVQLLYVTLGLQTELHNCRCHITSLRSPPCC
jgi:hypothetical protein